MLVNPKRARILVDVEYKRGPIVYWMSRDQRVRDNWAFLFAQEQALKFDAPLIVIFCLNREFLGASLEPFQFMLQGLRRVERELMDVRVLFSLLVGSPDFEVVRFVNENEAGVLVTDFGPLNISKEWKRDIAGQIDIPFYEVDPHNIVPCWLASRKQEYAARTFRPKIHRLMPEFLENFPDFKIQERLQKAEFDEDLKTDWERAKASLVAQTSTMNILGPPRIVSGEEAAEDRLRDFIGKGLGDYGSMHKDRLSIQSGLSPYLHFGQIASQRIALRVFGTELKAGAEFFLEELIVRKELSDNFCHYNPSYDSISCFPDWARKSLEKHSSDDREYVYRRDEFETVKTHDPLWNAAQREMVLKGKMHGYMRMYWAKKILEWTESPKEALEIAIYLNDKYELDGRDPNGYAGIAWCIGGVHDRALKERPIFGKIRYMSYNGVRSKFDTKTYIRMAQETL